MTSAIKTGLKMILPPIVATMARKLRPQVIRFRGDYSSWQDAQRDATGYDASQILQRVVAATREVEAGRAVFERDSVAFDRIEYSWPLLASLLQVGLEQRSLRVVDFGGALGSTWRQNRAFLKRLSIPIRWNVVEQAAFVEAGQREFENETLHFRSSIASASEGGADVVLFCSSLSYVPEPRDFIEEAARNGIKYLIADRLPVTERSNDYIMIQEVGEPIYVASYPVRQFAESRLFTDLFSGWRLIERWDCELQLDQPARYCGFFLERQ